MFVDVNIICDIMISMTIKEIKRRYYLKNKSKFLNWNNNYRRRPEIREKLSKQNKRNYRLNPRKSLYSNAKYRAKAKNIEFNININDINIPEFCPYLGIKLIPGSYKERKMGNAPTIDRIDPDIGYTPENIEVISDLANRMKQNATREQLITFAKNILSRFS